jgi:4-hydroxy-tetrahydrodipicolinate reductase
VARNRPSLTKGEAKSAQGAIYKGLRFCYSLHMNCLISGYGKMGRLIAGRLREGGHTVVGVIEPNGAREAAESGLAFYKTFRELPEAVLGVAEVAFEFTHPAVVVDNIKNFVAKKIPLVVGTTGWYERLDELKVFVQKNNASLLYAANFSLGVNLFYRIAGEAAKLFDRFDGYDVAGLESHHNKKADSPSGTAKTIAQILLDNMSRKTKAVYDKLDRPPACDEIHFASVRVGSVPGTHTVFFDSSDDSIEITHTARNRDGLVQGAIIAGEWLSKTVAAGKSGVYTFYDVLND